MKSLVDLVYRYGELRYYDAESEKISFKQVIAYLNLRRFMLFTGMYIQPTDKTMVIVTDKQHSMLVCWKHKD